MMKNEKGFTLLEAMISIALMGLIAILTLGAFNAGTRAWDVNYTGLRLNKEVRTGIERMTRELRNSDLSRISIPQANTLQFQVPSAISANGAITWSGWWQYSLGGVNGQQVLRQDMSGGGGVTTTIANGVTALQFVANANPSTVTITMTAQGTTQYGTVTSVANTGTVQFRN